MHGDSLLRRVGRGAVRPFRPADEVRRVTENGRLVQQPVTTGRRIAVMGVQGGSGKSTITALIASVYARQRGDRVLAMDLDPEFGSLPLRLGVRAEHSLADLARADPGSASFDRIEPYLTRPGERLWALPGTRGGVGADAVDTSIYRAVGVQLSRFFGITVMDNGVGIRSALHRAVLSSAHAQILVAPATIDGAAGVGRALDWLAVNGFADLRSRTLVVFAVHTPHLERLVDVERAADILGEEGIGTVKMSYDRQLAMGTTLDHARLAYATRVTAIAIAAEALRLSLDA